MTKTEYSPSEKALWKILMKTNPRGFTLHETRFVVKQLLEVGHAITPIDGDSVGAKNERRVNALMALTHFGIDTDIQGLLVHGDASQGVRPGALDNLIATVMRPAPATGDSVTVPRKCTLEIHRAFVDEADRHTRDFHYIDEFYACWDAVVAAVGVPAALQRGPTYRMWHKFMHASAKHDVWRSFSAFKKAWLAAAAVEHEVET